MSLVWLSLIVLGASAGIAAVLALSRAPRVGEVIAAAGAVTACVVGALASIRALIDPIGLPQLLDGGTLLGPLQVGLDPLSAFFLVPLCLLGGLAAIYGPAYLASSRPQARAVAALELNLLLAAMIAVLAARNALLLLIAWEVMTVTSYLLVVFEHERADVRRAGFVYLIAGHVGVGCLVLLFLLLDSAGGGLDFVALASGARQLSGPTAVIAALLAGVGFGVKAGLFPVHVWLPEAHAAAPSHVSALMSGVLIKLGVYGLLRMGLLLAPAAGWAHVLLALGVAGALYGIVQAVAQRDLKKALAYSSVENIGIVLLGLGLSFWAGAHGHPVASALALAGALLHVWNHAVMKGLMFLCAGSLLHGAHTRDLERMGGLLQRMPRTATAAVLGAAAMSALPPLNGFASEWLVYLGLARVGLHEHGHAAVLAMLAIGALALTGGLAALTFARLSGIALLGQPRTAEAAHAHESSAWMTAPIWTLALLVVAGGALPSFAIRLQRGVTAQLLGASVPEIETMLAPIGYAAAAIWSAVILGVVVLAVRIRKPAPAVGTWDCGYAAPSSRMQYTGRGVAELLLSHLVPRPLRPTEDRRPPQGLFPGAASLSVSVEEPLTRDLYQPFLIRWAERFSRVRVLQQGSLQLYMVFVFAVVVLGLGWLSVREWLWP